MCKEKTKFFSHSIQHEDESETQLFIVKNWSRFQKKVELSSYHNNNFKRIEQSSQKTKSKLQKNIYGRINWLMDFKVFITNLLNEVIISIWNVLYIS